MVAVALRVGRAAFARREPAHRRLAQNGMAAQRDRVSECRAMSDPSDLPLAGLRIVDLTSVLFGPYTTQFIFDYRRRVEGAPEAAFVTVNRTAGRRLGERLDRIGVGYERLELMKPVLLRLDRKVDPEELFPGREFPWR